MFLILEYNLEFNELILFGFGSIFQINKKYICCELYYIILYTLRPPSLSVLTRKNIIERVSSISGLTENRRVKLFKAIYLNFFY